MDPRLLKYYNRELQHLREMGAEFAREFPKIAGRLGLEGIECADPYVERMLEGFAFMAARVQLKIDAEFPQFTERMFDLIYPHYLAPTPSMAVVQFAPDLAEGSLADGFVLPRDTSLRSLTGRGISTACEYRTAHELKLWPLEITEAKYFPTAGALANINIENLAGVKAGIRFSLKATAGLAFDEIALDDLPLYLCGGDDVARQLYEQLLGNCVGFIVRPKGGARAWQQRFPPRQLCRYGFDDEQALLPYTRRSFHGYRLLQEYFVFPERFMFVQFTGLREALARCGSTELEIVVLLDRSVAWMESAFDASHIALFCAPVINLFPRRADRIHVERGKSEYHVLADRTRPMDFEVHSVLSVSGFSTGNEVERRFQPFYSARDPFDLQDQSAYFMVNREPRMLSARQRRKGARSSYIGSEVYVAIVDGREAPFSPGLRQLEVRTMCTNRDLPLQLTLGKSDTDFSLETGAPVDSIRCIAGPTRPRPSTASGDTAWRLLSHLSLNYLSIVDDGDAQGATTLRQLLSLYANANDPGVARQLESIKSVASTAVVRRMPIPGPITFGRGIEITVGCDETGFEGMSLFLLGAVLDEFFTKQVSVNSFTETVVSSEERGEVMRWPARVGLRQTL
mgnify:FL=1